MTIIGIRSTSKLSGALSGDAVRHDERPESRALVVVTPVADVVHEPLANYREASFLAQLIATKEQLPQTRERRRVAPYEAIAAYRAADALAVV